MLEMIFVFISQLFSGHTGRCHGGLGNQSRESGNVSDSYLLVFQNAPPPHDPGNDDDDQNNLITIVTMVILSKDARLPEQLQRAMAAEAEAAREARAKVISLS